MTTELMLWLLHIYSISWAMAWNVPERKQLAVALIFLGFDQQVDLSNGDFP
jgi:hypothetical protein